MNAIIDRRRIEILGYKAADFRRVLGNLNRCFQPTQIGRTWTNEAAEVILAQRDELKRLRRLLAKAGYPQSPPTADLPP